jgi:hypothetical protein
MDFAHEIAELNGQNRIMSLAFDRRHINDLKRELDAIGCQVPLESHGQGAPWSILSSVWLSRRSYVARSTRLKALAESTLVALAMLRDGVRIDGRSDRRNESEFRPRGVEGEHSNVPM